MSNLAKAPKCGPVRVPAFCCVLTRTSHPLTHTSLPFLSPSIPSRRVAAARPSAAAYTGGGGGGGGGGRDDDAAHGTGSPRGTVGVQVTLLLFARARELAGTQSAQLVLDPAVSTGGSSYNRRI